MMTNKRRPPAVVLGDISNKCAVWARELDTMADKLRVDASDDACMRDIHDVALQLRETKRKIDKAVVEHKATLRRHA